jgi:adenine phosphoribosyltransferase
MDILAKVRTVPDFPKPGIMFKDITTLLSDAEALRHVIDRMAARYRGRVDVVVGIESRGFVFGAPLAVALGVGFVPVRKGGKLPADVVRKAYSLEYGEAELELHRDAIAEGQRVVIVDDVLATGGTMGAACELVEAVGGRVEEIWVLIELGFLNPRAKLPGRAIHAEAVLSGE